jgi:channel protein (hemolysin III family)
MVDHCAIYCLIAGTYTPFMIGSLRGGMSFLGLSAAFWGLMFGLVAHLLLSVRRKAAPAVAPLGTTNLANEEASG